MRFALTKYGWPQMVIFPAIVLAAMILVARLSLASGRSPLGEAEGSHWSLVPRLSIWVIISIEAGFAVVLIWILSFFRDPYRVCPVDKSLLLAPADGRITDIETVEENGFIGRPALKIGIFLSIFDVHINRAPCNVTVERITYRPGKYKNAAKPSSAKVNESNELDLCRTDHPRDRLIVRQISGAIARRIVCGVREGQKLSGGEKFGMIKFGSRTELYFAASGNMKVLVRVGDKVKAGLTPLVKYEMQDTNNGKVQD